MCLLWCNFSIYGSGLAVFAGFFERNFLIYAVQNFFGNCAHVAPCKVRIALILPESAVAHNFVSIVVTSLHENSTLLES